MDLKPIIPFEPVPTDDFPQGKQWIAQVKWDGVRILAYRNGKEIKLFNRKKNERTFHYPELQHLDQSLKAKSAILDGEIIALKDGKPSFYEVMKRDGLRKIDRVPAVQKQVPVTYMVFDLLYLDGHWLIHRPLSERTALLDEICEPSGPVQLVPSFEDGKALFEAVKEHGLEGIVFKDLNSTYAIGGKDHRWRKKKNVQDLIAVVGGVVVRGSMVHSLLLGLYDEKDRLWYIGHAGTGKLTHEDWKTLTRMIQPVVQENMPFVNPPSRLKNTLWLKPVITVKVQYLEWSHGHTLRQPSIQAFVTHPPHQCRLDQ